MTKSKRKKHPIYKVLDKLCDHKYKTSHCTRYIKIYDHTLEKPGIMEQYSRWDWMKSCMPIGEKSLNLFYRTLRKLVKKYPDWYLAKPDPESVCPAGTTYCISLIRASKKIKELKKTKAKELPKEKRPYLEEIVLEELIGQNLEEIEITFKPENCSCDESTLIFD